MPRPPLRRRGSTVEAVADAVVSYHRQHRVDWCRAILPRRAASIFRGEGAVTACLAPLKLTCRGSISFSPAATAIAVRSTLYASRWAHISLCTISGVLHRRNSICITDLIDYENVPISIPPPLIQVAELSAINRRVEDRGDDLETLGAVVLVAGIDGHLPHPQGLRVAAILLPSHPARLVRPLPKDDIAVGPTLHRPAPHPFRLHTGDQVDAELPELACEEVVVEQCVCQDHVAGGKRVVHPPQ